VTSSKHTTRVVLVVSAGENLEKTRFTILMLMLWI
jgi:hypothetical protein